MRLASGSTASRSRRSACGRRYGRTEASPVPATTPWCAPPSPPIGLAGEMEHLALAGWLAPFQFDLAGAATSLEESLALYRDIGDEVGFVNARDGLGDV